MVDSALVERARSAALEGVSALICELPALLPDAIERRDKSALSRIAVLFEGIRDTLIMLGRPATAQIASEALAVVEAFLAGALVERPASCPEDVLHALLGAHDALLDAVADSASLLRPGDAPDTATPALAVLNELRSLRGEPFLSHALLIALNIPVDPGGTEIPALFAERVRESRPRLMRSLVDWFRAANEQRSDAVASATGRLAAELATLAEQALEAGIGGSERDLLLAAMRVCQAVADGHLDGSGAVRRLFALVERWLVERWTGARDGGSAADSQTTVSLLRNLLFYAALVEPAAARETRGSVPAVAAAASELDERYDLARLRHAAHEASLLEASARLPTRRLRIDIVARLREELAPIADWLAQGGHLPQDRIIAPRIARLDELRPVFELLGADACAHGLQRLRDHLSVDSDGAADGVAMLDDAARLAAASDLLQLDESLERLVSSVARTAPDDVLRLGDANRALATRLARVAAPVRRDASIGPMLDAAIVGLLAEARRRLAASESALESLTDDSMTGSVGAVAEQLRRIARGLDIVPRPEASALLDRLAEIVEWMPARPDLALRTALARLVVAIDACLDGASGTRTGAGPLDVAERALTALERELPAGRLLDADASPVDPVRADAAEADLRELTLAALDAFTAIGELLATERPSIGALAGEFAALRRLSRQCGADDLGRLSIAAGRRLERIEADRTKLAGPDDPDSLAAVRDAHIALPQLIERLASASRVGDVPGHGGLRNLDALIAALDDAPLAMQDDPHDTTLRAVFSEECADHLAVLDEALEFSRRSSTPWTTSERWLRALHTLVGSARTVSAQSIVSLVEPMQRASLERQRAGLPFTGMERDTLQKAVAALRQALQAFERGVDAPTPPDSLLESVQSLSRPRTAEPPSLAAQRIDDRRATLDEIFDEEAHDLLDRLQSLANESLSDNVRRERALSVLHTLKGSARVAGRAALADATHDGEARLSQSGADASVEVIGALRRALNAVLDAPALMPEALSENGLDAGLDTGLDTGLDAAIDLAVVDESVSMAATGADAEAAGPLSVRDPERSANDATTRVRDADWERLTVLSQDIAASQARLAVELRRLREASAELDVAAQRWRRLPAAASLLETEAARELLDDLQAVRSTLSASLRTVDLEQRRAARAGIALQQDLVRARLIRFDRCEARLQRTLDDAAASVDRSVELDIDGGTTTLDASLHARMLPALEHLVRNAVVHGIESAVQRRRAGKSATGRVRVSAVVEGLEFVVRVHDDGVGIAASLEPTGARAGVDSLLDRLAAPGFSTLPSASGVAGRGLGLGAARERIVELGGRLALLPRDAVGTTFEVRVPQRIPVQQVVLVRAGELIAVPVNFIDAIETLDDDRHASVPANRSRDTAPPSLDALLGHAGVRDRSDPGNDCESRRLLRFAPPCAPTCVIVDAVIGYRELVVQPLDAQLASLGRYSGVAALPDGQRVFVIDPRALSRRLQVEPVQRPVTALGPLALVADDSPTQRAWARDTLEALGFQVRTERDGRAALDALEELAATPPAVMLLDVDMPRVDGYGVLQALQDRGDTGFPVIVMTSRSSTRDRDAALGFGASAFLAKPGNGDDLRDALLRVGAMPVDRA